MVIALRELKFKTSKGLIVIKPGQAFKPSDPDRLIKAGLVKPTQELFKETFNRLASHLRQRSFDKYAKKKLAKLAEVRDKAWEALDYTTFENTIAQMIKVPGLLKAEGGKPLAARVYSHILEEEVWVCNSPEAMSLVPEGEVCYLPDEISNLRGATPKELRQVHMVKKEVGGRLIAVRDVKYA